MELLRGAAIPRTVGELAAALERSGVEPNAARATVAWLLKYGLLATAEPDTPNSSSTPETP
jgi:hypothetical protein